MGALVGSRYVKILSIKLENPKIANHDTRLLFFLCTLLKKGNTLFNIRTSRTRPNVSSINGTSATVWRQTMIHYDSSRDPSNKPIRVIFNLVLSNIIHYLTHRLLYIPRQDTTRSTTCHKLTDSSSAYLSHCHHNDLSISETSRGSKSFARGTILPISIIPAPACLSQLVSHKVDSRSIH